MTFSLHISCTSCGQPYPQSGGPYHCLTCGGLFDYDIPLFYDASRIEPGKPGLWRYHYSLGLPENAPVISLGEGNTPLVEGEALGRKVYFKCEYQNPTASFKDRGSAVLTSFLKSREVGIAAEDSSGNAGASFAAYAARAGIQARIFIPEAASGPKRAQIEAYGAQIERVPGPRSNATSAVIQALEQDSALAYGSHSYLPINIPGYATTAYEIVEQLGQDPGCVILPAGQGGFLLGIGRGFEAMLQAKVIRQMPRLIGVQARACAPLWALFSYGPAGLGWVTEGQTLAEGVRVSRPLRGDTVLAFLKAHQGQLLAVDEEKILPARDELAHRGFYVEPTSAIVWEALAQLSGDLPDPVILVLTGSGLKSSI